MPRNHGTTGEPVGRPVTVDKEKLRELHAQGLSRKEMAERLGVFPTTVSRLLSSLDLSVDQRRIDDERVRELTAQNLNRSQIGRIMGFHPESIARAQKRAGIEPYRPNGRERDERVKELTLKCWTRAQIAEELGITMNMVDGARERTGARGREKSGRLTSPRRYDREEFLRLSEANWSAKRIAEHFNCAIDTVYRLRREMGLSTPQHPDLAPLNDRLEQARSMVEDGASFAEVTRTTHVSRKVLAREFPGKQWTQKQATELAIAVRQANRSIHDVWIQKNGATSLTRPIESHRV